MPTISSYTGRWQTVAAKEKSAAKCWNFWSRFLCTALHFVFGTESNWQEHGSSANTTLRKRRTKESSAGGVEKNPQVPSHKRPGAEDPRNITPCSGVDSVIQLVALFFAHPAYEIVIYSF